MKKVVTLWLMILFATLAPSFAWPQDYQTLFRDFQATDLSRDDKRFLQTALAFEGHYNGLIDGDWGTLSRNALESYSRKEFGTSAEDWHMAVLAFSFFDIYERDGWAIRHLDALGLSMLHPFDAVRTEPPTERFINWRHVNSSLAYSVGIHSVEAAEAFHQFTWDSHNAATEPYSLRRTNVAITTATKRNGSVLYTRSNFINGSWSTVMLSAQGEDVPILNAVAASIGIGRSDQILFTENGRLHQVIDQTIAFASNEAPDNSGPVNRSSTASAKDEPPSSGTGFVVSNLGDVLTNAHVVEGCHTLRFDAMPAEISAVSTDLDLALIRVEGWGGERIATFSPLPARLNSDVTVVGYPLAGLLAGLNVTRGSVSSQMGLGGSVTSMQISAPVQPGNSGGPVLAADGEVVGIVVSKLNAQAIADATGDIPQNVNFAIRGEIAKLFMFQHGIEPLLGTNDEPLAPVDLAAIAKDFTGFIECN